MSALLFALTAISLAAQQTIGLNRLYSCEDGLLKIRNLLGEANPKHRSLSMGFYGSESHDTEGRIRIKRSQIWTWQTPIMLSNFSILLFIVGLMIAIFVRAAATLGDFSKSDTKVFEPSLLKALAQHPKTHADKQIAIFYGCAAIFVGTNYLVCWVSLNRGSLHSMQPETS